MQETIKKLNRQIRKYGVDCVALGKAARAGVKFKAIVSDFLTRDTRFSKRQFGEVGRLLGVDLPDTKQLYAEYRAFWDDPSPLRILIEERTYDVIYDSVIRVAGDPCYVMAILEPTAKAKDDFAPIGGDDDAA